MNILIYNTTTGEINRACDTPEGTEESQCGAGESYVVGAGDPATYWIVDGEIVERPDMDLNIARDVLNINWLYTIEGIPPGTRVEYVNGIETVNDGFISWFSSEPGVFPFRLTCFPYKRVLTYATVT